MFSKDSVKKKFEKALAAFQERLMRVHTRQVNPSLVEDITVKYQGFDMKVKELGSIRTEGPRTLVIEPWDKASIADIEKGLLQVARMATPQAQGSMIYLNFPTLTQEMRETVIKEIGDMKEEARIRLRRVRDDAWELIQEGEKEREIREDDKFAYKEDLQKLVDEYNKKIEEVSERKIKSLEI